MTIDELLKQVWGYDAFRPMQREIIESVLAGHDVLALLPTGGGKSVCFQVPALAQPGLCLVISPLIALMKDQVENLRKRGIHAEAVYSGMSYRQIDHTLDACIYGDVKFLYVSPERLRTELFRVRAKQMKINLIAVDEAHCVSAWGYDFRPPYLQIAEFRELFPKLPLLALTATATREVKADIVQKLAMRNERIFSKALPGLIFPIRLLRRKIRKYAYRKSLPMSPVPPWCTPGAAAVRRPLPTNSAAGVFRRRFITRA
ncbi:DEAD/DEAH box helicase [Siphonobacter sp. BAB-5385]|uniref:DEAD/DEAH box helicase n=1 Tax=unclassified Siphonobacter TaxID=2635712 RepID=UPI00269FA7FE